MLEIFYHFCAIDNGYFENVSSELPDYINLFHYETSEVIRVSEIEILALGHFDYLTLRPIMVLSTTFNFYFIQ